MAAQVTRACLYRCGCIPAELVPAWRRVHVFVVWAFVAYALVLLRWHYKQVGWHWRISRCVGYAVHLPAHGARLVGRGSGCANQLCSRCQHSSARCTAGQTSSAHWQSPGAASTAMHAIEPCAHASPTAPLQYIILRQHYLRKGDDANYWRELHLPRRSGRQNTPPRLAQLLKQMQASGRQKMPVSRNHTLQRKAPAWMRQPVCRFGC